MQTCLVGITIATPTFAENQSKQQSAYVIVHT